MTSPITHENIIEVLRAIVDANDEYRSGLIDGWTDPMDEACGRARDLYQRLQAEKEGGDVAQMTAGLADRLDEYARRMRAVFVGDDTPSVDLEKAAALLRRDPYPPVERLRELRLFLNEERQEAIAWEHDEAVSNYGLVMAILSGMIAAKEGFPPLNQEGGDATGPSEQVSGQRRRDVAPPASGTDSSGRATTVETIAETVLNKWQASDKVPAIPSIEEQYLLSLITAALASEFDRGRRSGIEQAAKVADEIFNTTMDQTELGSGARLTAIDIADRIRALLTNPEKTI